MSEHYSHLLIPNRTGFAPLCAQVIAFFKALHDCDSAPLDAEVLISKPSEKVRIGRNALTGEQITIRQRESLKSESLETVEKYIQGHDDYSVFLVGRGPALVPPFPLFSASDSQWQSEVVEPYYYEVSCNLRPGSISFSENSWHESCDHMGADATTTNPWNGQKIHIPGAGCARFWIEFTFGNWLVPKIDVDLALLVPIMPALASSVFETAFTQSGIFL